MDQKILNTIRDSTIIEAGHYSYKNGPTDLDIFLWEIGVEAYAYAKKHFKNIGLLVLVDDMHDVETNEERRVFKINKLPEIYSEILKKYEVKESEVIIVSQNKMRDKGRRLLRDKGMSRSQTPQCRLIVATLIREKEKKGYDNAVALYDEVKSGYGSNLTGGIVFSRLLYGAKIDVHNFVFKDKDSYEYYSANKVVEEKNAKC